MVRRACAKEYQKPYSRFLLLRVSDGHNTCGQALLAPGNLALAGSLVLGAAGLKLFGDGLLAQTIGLLLVDGLHQHALVLVDITLHLGVQLAVQVAVNLLRVTVLLEHAAQNTQAAHPQHLGREASLAGTTALSCEKKGGQGAERVDVQPSISDLLPMPAQTFVEWVPLLYGDSHKDGFLSWNVRGGSSNQQ